MIGTRPRNGYSTPHSLALTVRHLDADRTDSIVRWETAVPCKSNRDQYAALWETMKNKIRGCKYSVTDPREASWLICRASDHTARNITCPGPSNHVTYDIAEGSVVSLATEGLFALTASVFCPALATRCCPAQLLSRQENLHPHTGCLRHNPATSPAQCCSGMLKHIDFSISLTVRAGVSRRDQQESIFAPCLRDEGFAGDIPLAPAVTTGPDMIKMPGRDLRCSSSGILLRHLSQAGGAVGSVAADIVQSTGTICTDRAGWRCSGE